MSSNRVPIKYTSRDFESIKRDLVDYAKRYYPDTFRDFSEASFGSLMIDTVAYIGDILSFYIDYQVNESFVNSAVEYSNVINHGEQAGYHFSGASSAYGVCAFYIKVPANVVGEGPDQDYLPILKKGTTVSSSGGTTFILLEDVDFSDPRNEVVGLDQNADDGTRSFFGVQAFGPVVSGELGTETIEVGNFERFLSVNLSATDVVEVLSVIDSEGHIYYQVPFLSQNVIHRGIPNRARESTSGPAAIVKPFVVPRRFVVKRSRRRTSLQFGHGSDSETNRSSIADPTDVVTQRLGRSYISDTSFDPSKLLDSDKFGIAPSNTTLTIRYRRNNSRNANASAGSVTRVVDSVLEFQDPTSLNSASRRDVINSLGVTNLDPISGDTSTPSIEELRQHILDNIAAQNRAVTEQDYKSLIYSMPRSFGSVTRCGIYRDSDSFRRNLNLYVISQDNSGFLVSTNDQIKQNLKTWLGQYKMINDTIDILDAKVVNIQLKYSVVIFPGVESSRVFRNINNALGERYSRKFDIGESFDLSEMRRIIMGISGVASVRNAQVLNIFGGRYSSISYNVLQNTDSQNRFVEAPRNVIFELKHPNADIIGTVR